MPYDRAIMRHILCAPGAADEAEGIVIESLEYTIADDGSSVTVVITGTLGDLGRHELVIGETYEEGSFVSYLAMIDGQLYTMEIPERE